MGSKSEMGLYTDHFGLARNPFTPGTSAPPPFPSRELQEALAHYQYARQNRESFFLLVGEVGTGKSTAIQVILDALGPETPVAVLRHTSLDARELLEEVIRRFGIDTLGTSSKPELLARLEAFLRSASERALAVLIIDEAHLLSNTALEEVRLLSNLKQGERPLVQILLVGQPELVERLRQHRLRPLRQRIAVRYVFGKLTAEETREYIRHRLKAAGAGAPQRIFSHGAADAVHELTTGLPREINVIADQAMLNAFLDSSPAVERRHVSSTKNDYGFEGVEVERPAQQTNQPAPVAAVGRDVQEGSPGTETRPGTRERRRDLPLQIEPRFTLLTQTPGSRNGSRAFAVTAIATGLLGALALGYVLYSRAVSDEFWLPQSPPSLSKAPPTLAAPAIPELPRTEPMAAGSSLEPSAEQPANVDEPRSPKAPPKRGEAVEVRMASAGSIPFLTAPPPSRSAIAADRLELGAYLARSGRLDEAIAAFREAVELEPNYPAALFNLGVSLLEKGQAPEAVDVLRRATSISPDDGMAQRSLGIALRESGKLAEALAALQRALELTPNDELALRHLAWVLRESGDVDGAIEATRKTIALKPGDASLQQELGFDLRAAGRLPEAADAFRRALDLDGNLAIAHYSLGVTLLEIGDREGGEREIAEARRLGFEPR